MSNSSLVSLKQISPNKTSPRANKIDTISIHCMAGQLSIESCGSLFKNPSYKASSNYGIGPDGRIALYVDEKDRSWCTSSTANDNRAVTIEVASDSKSPYKVTKAAYDSLLILVADICKRNNIKKLLWKGDKSLIGQVDKQNMTVHRWFAPKACPGDYLYGKHAEIAKLVNQILEGKKPDSIDYDDYDKIGQGDSSSSSSSSSSAGSSYDPYGTSAKTSTGSGVNINIQDKTELAAGNSSLANYVSRVNTPNATLREVDVSCITIHIAKTKDNLKKIASMIKSSNTSYNYGIDSDGNIGMFVDEACYANCSDDKYNDGRSVNIVCSNSTLKPNYEISEACYQSLVDLCEDICRRRFIWELAYIKDNPKGSTLTLHNQFKKDADCPGPYLEKKLPELIETVNRRLATENRQRVTVTSYQAESETAALRAQSTVSLGAIHPYVARITDNSLKLNYEALQQIGVVGLLFHGGEYYDEKHKVKARARDPKLHAQIQALEASSTKMPYAIEFTSRAATVKEAKLECSEFYYILTNYHPKLGAWVHIDLDKNTSNDIAAAIVEIYYEHFVRWGFKSKCGIIATKAHAKQIGWPIQAAYMPLWLEGALDKNIAPKEEVLTPSYFKLDDLTNKGYNEKEDKGKVERYVNNLKSQYGASSEEDARRYAETHVATKNIEDYTQIQVPQTEGYTGMKKYESYTSITVTSSLQWKMAHEADMTVDSNGFCKWGGRYGVAVGSVVCKTIGTYIDVVLENGTVIKCVMFDMKSDDDTTANHMFTDSTNPCCSEFTVDLATLNPTVKQMGDCSYLKDKWKSKVKEFRVYQTNWLDKKKK